MVEGSPGPLDFRRLRRAAERTSGIDNASCLDLSITRTEAAVGLEAPVRGSDHPILRSLDVEPEAIDRVRQKAIYLSGLLTGFLPSGELKDPPKLLGGG